MINKPAIILILAMLQFSAHAQQTYQLDTKKSKILWKAPKTMGNEHYGYLLFNSGSLNYSPTNEPLGGTFSLNMNSISSEDHPSATDNQKVDEELKTEDFFDVAKYPTATMSIKQIVRVDNTSTFKVTGNLTIKGITNLIEFKATIKKNGNTINVVAKLRIDRMKWNIRHQSKKWDLFSKLKDGVIGDQIPVSLNLIFNK